jgi:hypothetical protein
VKHENHSVFTTTYSKEAVQSLEQPMDDEERQHLERLLEQHRSNLRRLEAQAAAYGMTVPLPIQNELDHAQGEIARITSLLGVRDRAGESDTPQKKEEWPMDPAALIPLIGPAIMAATAYLRDHAAEKAGEKAAEAVGTEAGKALASVGPKALATLRGWFVTKSDPKAQQALANVEQDPTDDDYQHKLLKETARLASLDPAFAQELKILAEQVTVAQSGSTVQTINNQAPNQGAQGVFNAPVSFDSIRRDDEQRKQ